MNDLIAQQLSSACRLLATARDAQSAKRVVDIAHAAEVYAKRQKLSEDVIAHAREIKVDALTAMGEYLQAAPKNKGANGSVVTGSRREPVKDRTPTLAEVGIGKKESSDAQALHALQERRPELHEQVRRGAMTVAQARRAVDRDTKRQELQARAQANGNQEQGRWQIVHGNALELLGKLAERPRLIFADPPYNLGVDYGGGTKADRRPLHDYLAWCADWMAACWQALADDGSLWVLINHENAAYFELLLGGCEIRLEPGGPALTGMARFPIRARITWYETFGVNCANNFNRCSRRLFYCVKDPSRFVFNAAAVNRLSDRQAKYGDSRADPGGKIWDDVWPIPRLVGTAKERIPDFPTQLPLELVEAVVGCASDPGDLVADPFSGSGTTGAAALRLGRRFIGFEKEAEFVRLSRARLAAQAAAEEDVREWLASGPEGSEGPPEALQGEPNPDKGVPGRPEG
jgi:site-specific DNA-methyltransferase (adenine-specific)